MVTIFFLVYQTGTFWLSLFNKCLAFLVPITLGFTLAYALNPMLRKLNKYLPNFISLILIVVMILGFITFISVKVFPLILNQIISLINNLSVLAINRGWSNHILDIFDKISNNLWQYVTSGITFSFSLISNLVVVLTTGIYFLKDMDKIRSWFLNKVNNKELWYQMDYQITNYFKGLIAIMVITFFEYSLFYLIIDHPEAILLGIIAAIANLIPQFGSLAVHILAILTSLSISSNLLVKTVIVVLLCSIVDGYIINPLVYGKSNQLHPLITIITILIGSSLFGFMGMVVALPLTIILISIYNYVKV